MQEPSDTTSTTIPSKDKGKGIMVEEPLKMKKKDQVLFDEQEAIRLQAQFDEEERIAREKEEANASLSTQWNDIQDFTKKLSLQKNVQTNAWFPIVTFVGIKSLLEVTTVKLVMLVQKLLLLVLKFNVAGIKVTTAKRIKTAQRKDKDCLWDMYEIFL
ncbi:hypothetical protein Tco_1140810 [Tanacetum coccineum]